MSVATISPAATCRGTMIPARRSLLRRRSLALWLLTAVALTATGCRNDLDTTYGRRGGYPGAESVNGTAVLAEMFGQAGHRVTSWRYLSPRLWRADTIVWFPNRFEPPQKETREWLANWLDETPGGTLIYVGRDYDAAQDYFKDMLTRAPPGQQTEYRRRAAAAGRDFNVARSGASFTSKSDPQDDEWFTFRETPARRRATTLGGDWSRGIDPAKARIETRATLVPTSWAEVLLESSDEPLVSRQEWATSSDEPAQIIVVSNGSFLLNVPLVNYEHRKLAGRLVDAVGPPGRVVFLESGPLPPDIRETEDPPQTPTGMEIFFVWPLNCVLLHLALLGVVYAFARAPIFGLPREPPAPTPSDFGKHVAALGELLQNTGDRGYARERVRHYQQIVRDQTRLPD